MATKLKGVEALNLLPQIPTKENRTIKDAGLKYRLVKPILVPGFKIELPAIETTMEECNDGWFQVFDGDKIKGYRLGPKFIEQIIDCLKQEKK